MPRYTCDVKDLEHNFVEYSDSWSRGETRTAYSGANDELLPLLQRKITKVHLDCVGAEPITDASDLTEERLDEIDTRVYSWFILTWIKCLNDLSDLGNAAGRKLFDSSETKTTSARLRKN